MVSAFRGLRVANKSELSKCFTVMRAFARQLHKKRGMTTLPVYLRLSQGLIAGASAQGSADGLLRTITYVRLAN
jgi:hypothetical protein